MVVSDIARRLNEYVFKAPYHIEKSENGMNNTTTLVTSGDEKYVFRIYNNHKDIAIVQLEHEVLELLHARKPNFKVPLPVRNRHEHTVTIAADGTLSALFHYIDGDRPSIDNIEHIAALGKTAGLLSAELQHIKPSYRPVYAPYYELESTYAAMNESAFTRLTEGSEALAARKESIRLLQQERQLLEAQYMTMSQLPQQWIHGDLVFNNSVAIGADIVGVLDFEFVTIDARAMELAVIAVDLLKASPLTSVEKMNRLCEQFRATVDLTEQELQLLPSLMKLRLLDVALHFAIRYRDGLDPEHVLCEIIDQSAAGCRWLNERKQLTAFIGGKS